jgi:hypothetical protein
MSANLFVPVAMTPPINLSVIQCLLGGLGNFNEAA